MQLLTPLILFATIFTGTFHMVSVSALPYDSTEVSRHPVPFSNNNSLERRSPMEVDVFKAKLDEVHRLFDTKELVEAHKAVAKIYMKNLARYNQIENYVQGKGSKPQGLSTTDEAHFRLVFQYMKALLERGINPETTINLKM
ncbi:hypothetical protein BC835DRAFT_1409867 [Cytidiella melzeri]|nr:hypothetical protein BC835DRAFT_1424030 [Cytidiella melzeri]KAI0705802.1 hypothetical protein BC835DRAFT_1409867 [Cytidiella melzeri]